MYEIITLSVSLCLAFSDSFSPEVCLVRLSGACQVTILAGKMRAKRIRMRLKCFLLVYMCGNMSNVNMSLMHRHVSHVDVV